MHNLNIREVPQNFIETPIFADEYIFGGNSKIEGTVLRENGDWRDLASTMFEDQHKNGVESMSCTVYGTLNAIEMLMRQKFALTQDYSERYTSTLAGTTRSGNSPHKVAETIRAQGLLDESRLPFSAEITKWEEYFAPIPHELRVEGKKWNNPWDFEHDWAITRDTRKEEKNEILKDALPFSPIGVSVFGWADEKGVYVKVGNDNHWALLIHGDRDYWYVLDSYPPYIKKLSKDYDFGFAKRYNLDRVAKRKCFISFIQKLRTI